MEAPQTPESFSFRCPLTVRWSDEDNQGVLNNAVYLTLLEEARHAYFSRLGLLEGNRFPFVLAQTNIRFLAPGHGPAPVEVELATTRLGDKSFEQAYRIRGADGTPWAEAEALLVAWDNGARRSCSMSDGFRRAVAEFEGLPA